MSKNLEASAEARRSALIFGLAALLLSLAGIIPTYGIIGSVAGLVLGIVAQRKAKRSRGVAAMWCAVFAIYLAVLRILVTLAVVFWFDAAMTTSEPHKVTVPAHAAAPAKPDNAATPKP
jgi:uncharacterized membrane protein